MSICLMSGEGRGRLLLLQESQKKPRQDHRAAEDLHHPLDLLLLTVVERWRLLPLEELSVSHLAASRHCRQPGFVGEGEINRLGSCDFSTGGTLSLSPVPISVPGQAT